jgi:dienelactone hydrolase
VPAGLEHARLDPANVRAEPEDITVEDSILLDAYTWFHAKGYRALRVEALDEASEPVVGHLLIPPGDERQPLIVVFPILAGSHLVSEALAKVFVDRHYAVLRIERRALELEKATDPDHVARNLSSAVRDARRLLDWAVTRPEIDPQRIGAAGVSLGSLMACLLQAVDGRVTAGFFALTGGGLTELIYDSKEVPVRAFRDHLIETQDLRNREAFIAYLEPHALWVDPLTYAGRIEADSVLMLTGRFDAVIPPDRARALWQALGQPRWIKMPTGHYQAVALLWYGAARGADHFDRRFRAVRDDLAER